jgi:hypothetical protein
VKIEGYHDIRLKLAAIDESTRLDCYLASLAAQVLLAERRTQSLSTLWCEQLQIFFREPGSIVRILVFFFGFAFLSASCKARRFNSNASGVVSTLGPQPLAF